MLCAAERPGECHHPSPRRAAVRPVRSTSGVITAPVEHGPSPSARPVARRHMGRGVDPGHRGCGDARARIRGHRMDHGGRSSRAGREASSQSPRILGVLLAWHESRADSLRWLPILPLGIARRTHVARKRRPCSCGGARRLALGRIRRCRRRQPDSSGDPRSLRRTRGEPRWCGPGPHRRSPGCNLGGRVIRTTQAPGRSVATVRPRPGRSRTVRCSVCTRIAEGAYGSERKGV